MLKHYNNREVSSTELLIDNHTFKVRLFFCLFLMLINDWKHIPKIF